MARRKELTFINLLKNTNAYKKYLKNEKENISEDEIKEALRVETLTQKEITKRNLSKYMDYSNKIKDKSVNNFLKFIKKRLNL